MALPERVPDTNQGALPGGTAFVFVVDADNQHNPLGFAVSLTDDAIPPSAPANLVVDPVVP
jgi:hypothetical protein